MSDDLDNEAMRPLETGADAIESTPKRAGRPRGRTKVGPRNLEDTPETEKETGEKKKLTERARKAKIDRIAKEFMEETNAQILEQFAQMGVDPKALWKDGKIPVLEKESPYGPFGQRIVIQPSLAKAYARLKVEWEEGEIGIGEIVKKELPAPVRYAAKFGQVIVLGLVQVRKIVTALIEVRRQQELMKGESNESSQQNPFPPNQD